MNTSPAKIGDQITLHYRLICHGQEIVNTFPGQPETFTLGSGEIDPRLEIVLTGLAVGTHETFHLQPWQAFGEHNEALVQNMPRSDLPADQDLPIGHRIDFSLPNGQAWSGTLLEVGPDVLRVDFNHPLAGLDVELEVEILDIRTSP